VNLNQWRQRDIVTTLFIGGSGRSGSTILGRMLGQVSGFTFVGELDLLWQQGLVENRLCGCGVPFRTCDFWSEVGERAFAGWESLPLDEVRELAGAVSRHRYLPFTVAPKVWPDYARRLDRHSELLGRVFDGIREAAKCDVVVDSSKFPVWAYLLRHIRNVDLRLLHLVRDSRAVAYSWAKTVVEPGVPHTQAFMRQLHPARSAMHWMAFNAMCHPLKALGVPTLFLQYEAFAQDPFRAMQQVMRHAGVEPCAEDLTFLADGTAALSQDHSIAGNPMRFQTGTVAVRPDTDWKTSMSSQDQRVVTALTLPLLVRYGYPTRTRAGGSAS